MFRPVWVTAFLIAALTGACDRSKPAERTSAGSSVGSAALAPADDPWSGVDEPVKKDPLAHPLFWSATKDGITSYFLGTMHTGVDAEKRLPDSVWAKLDAAKTFAMETDIGDPAVANAGKRTSGTIHEDLGPDYYKKLEAIITPAMAKSIDGMKPMVAATLISLRGIPPTAPMDRVLHARALGGKKAIVYLEKAALQAEIVDKYMGIRELKLMIDTADKGVERMKRLMAAYVAGDDAALVALSDEEKADALAAGFTEAELAEQNEAMIYRRNASWIEPIEKLHAAGGGFIAVGALHLVGPKSVLELLAARGFTVTRVAP